MRALNPSIPSGVLIALTAACTPHEQPPTPPPAPSPAPAIVRELEPKPEPPPIVAPTLPPLAPQRPLSQLELRWTNYDQAEPSRYDLWSLGTRLAPLPEPLAAALGLSGPPDPSDGLPVDETLRRAGPLVLALSPAHIAAYEAGREGLRWEVPSEAGARSYLHYIGERVLVAVHSNSAGDTLSAWALEDGRRLWSRAPGGPDSFERVAELGGDAGAGWGWVVHERGFESFDLLSGQTRWTTTLERDCGVAVGEGQIVVQRASAYRVLAPDTGAELRQFPARVGRRCGWRDYAIPAGLVEAGRLLSFEDADDDRPPQLWSYPLTGGAEAWRAGGDYGVSVLAADHDAVFVATPDELGMIVLDASRGAPVFEFGFGGWFELDVEPVGGVEGPAVLVHDEHGVRWLFTRAEQPSAPERWEIRGRLVSDGYLDSKRLKGVRFEVGEVQVVTDKRGRFVARGSGRGVVPIILPMDEDSYDPRTGSRVEFEPDFVRLDGSERYDVGELQAYEGWYE